MKEVNLMNSPLVNITIPVFNRFHLTQRTILALYKTTKNIPFIVTVVDNGSEQCLRNRLIEFKESGLIDNLFLLPRNMGISCACNIGWNLIDTPFYMKLDNDMIATRPDWLERLFRLWSHGQNMSTLGPAIFPEWLHKNPGAIETQDGTLGICTSNLPGGATIIPKAVSDILGKWSEDYDLYGGEDGDYGMRMQAAGFKQYYYAMSEFFDHAGDFGSAEYQKIGLDKKEQHSQLFYDSKGIGTYLLNFYLYNACIRKWNVPLRYEIKDIDGYNVILDERKEYECIRTAIQRSKLILNGLKNKGGEFDMFSDAVLLRLKKIWKSCGQECHLLGEQRE